MTFSPTNDWDYLAVSNLVPPTDVRLSDELWTCALCGVPTTCDQAGALYTAPENCGLVCDSCGDRVAPDAMQLVRALRTRKGLTAVQGLPDTDDPDRRLCPVCHEELFDDELEQLQHKWHAADVDYGRPVCSRCAPGVDGELLSLIERLNSHERLNRLLDTIDPFTEH